MTKKLAWFGVIKQKEKFPVHNQSCTTLY